MLAFLLAPILGQVKAPFSKAEVVEVFATPTAGWRGNVPLLLDLKSERSFAVKGAVARLAILKDGRTVGPPQRSYALSEKDPDNRRPYGLMSPRHQAWISADFDRTGLAPGMYVLSGRVVFDLTRNRRRWSQTKRIAPIRLWLSPEGKRVPHRFVLTSGAYYPESPGKPGYGEQVGHMREWTLEEETPAGRRYRVEGRAEPVFVPKDGHLFLTPLKEDPELRDLRQRFEEQVAWMFGGTWAWGTGPDPAYLSLWEAPANRPPRIRRIFRVAGVRRLTLGRGEETSWTRTSFLALDPLLVTLDMPPEARPTEGWITPDTPHETFYADNPGLEMEPKTYSGWHLVVAGAWDFGRRFSGKNPFDPMSRGEGRSAAWAEWQRFDRAILQQKPTVGMTSDHVAWARGWPSEFKTEAQMRALPIWRYATADSVERLEFQRYPYEGQRLARITIRRTQ